MVEPASFEIPSGLWVTTYDGGMPKTPSLSPPTHQGSVLLRFEYAGPLTPAECSELEALAEPGGICRIPSPRPTDPIVYVILKPRRRP